MFLLQAMAKNGGKQDFHSRNGDLELHAKRRVTFKKASRDDLLTINVSGTIFYAQSSIFAKHPGKCSDSLFLF